MDTLSMALGLILWFALAFAIAMIVGRFIKGGSDEESEG